MVWAATIFLLAACSSRKMASTSTNNAYNVPTSVQTNFRTQYPDASNVTWSHYDAANVPIDWDVTDWTVLSPRDYTVTYDMGGNKYYSWYDANGNWVGSSYGITDYNNGLPGTVNTAIANRYSGYKIDKANKVLWKDRTAYNVKLKNGDDKVKLLIDQDGNIIKEKK
jgi:hypothetical protein